MNQPASPRSHARPRHAPETRRASIGSSIASLGLDLKLGARMLVKYPMLTLIGGIAIAVTSAIGVGAAEFVRDLFIPELPLDEGERIVRLYHVDTEAGDRVPVSLYDLEVWRGSVASIEDPGAYRTLEQGLVSDRGEAGTVSLARVSASAFRVTRVLPLMGRFLADADEHPGAPPVVVLGFETWQTLLGGDPETIGRTVEIAGTPTVVVGVMPEGYAFPQMQNAWVPFRVDPAELTPGSAPRAASFARLAPGASLESAQAELEIAGRRAAADHPEIYEHLRPGIVEFGRRGSDLQVGLLLSGVRLLLIFLLMVATANVATLVFARTVTREGEIAIRMSLGATRRRIVLQLFAETLVLVSAATLVGLGIAAFTLRRITGLFFEIQQAPQPPFWWNDALSPATVLYAGALAFAGALMIGLVPALKATAGSMHPRLGELAAGGGGLRFGGIWTVVIVLQVALSVAFLPLAVSQAGTTFASEARAAFPAESYLTAQLGRDAVASPHTPEELDAFLVTSQLLFEEVRARLAADPAVEEVALASGLSAMNHLGVPIEFVGDESEAAVSGGARILPIDRSYLGLMNADLIAGRTLATGDFTPDARSVVVNRTFVERVLGGRNPVGGRLDFPERRGESAAVAFPEVGASWDIVGVVDDPGIDAFGPAVHAAIYAPLDLMPVNPRAVGFMGMPQMPSTQLFVRTRDDAAAFTTVLYETVAAVDPALRLSDVGTAADAWGPVHIGARLGAWIFLAIAAIVLMLSVAGIYALMSFTVSQRTREIAIRSAMGAQRRQLLRNVFGRAAIQLSIGVALGSLIAGPVLWNGLDEGLRSLLIVATVLVAAGLGACYLPIRRALAIDPAAAMKVD